MDAADSSAGIPTGSGTSAGRRSRPWLLAAAAYVAVTAAMAWPLLSRLSTGVAHDAADPVLNMWILWWNAHHIPLTAGWWSPPVFYPVAGTFAFSESLIGLSVFATPLMWMGLSPEVANNVLFLVSFPASGLAMHWLVRTLTHRHDAAFIAGLAFAFTPYRAAQLAHMQVLWSFWMPVALVGLHRLAAGKRWGLALFAGAWLLQSLANGYYFVYFTWLVLLWLAWFLARRSTLRALAALALAWAAVALPVLWLMLGYKQRLGAFGLNRSIGEIETLSADILSVFSAAPEAVLWGSRLLGLGSERDLFPGLTVALMAAAIAAAVWRHRQSQPSGPAWRRWVLALAGVLTLVAASVPLVGAWAVRLPFLSLSVARFHKPFTVALAALAVYVMSSRRTWAVLRERSALGFYAVASVAMWVLSLGPTPRLGGFRVLYKAPYAWMMMVPGVDNLRVPARLGMLMALCLAIVIGVGFARTIRLQGRRRAILVGVCAAGIVADGWFGPMSVADAPAAWSLAVPQANADAVVELPMGSPVEDASAQYRLRFHGQATLNGYSGYAPPHYAILSQAVRLGEGDVIAALQEIGTIQAMTDRRTPEGRAWDDRLRASQAARALASDDQWGAWLLPRKRAGDPVSAVAEARIPIAGISIAADPRDIARVHDGNVASAWESAGPQRGGEQLVVDLGQERPVSGLSLSVGEHWGQWPRALKVELSLDGAGWRAAWSGDGLAPTVAGALRRPRAVPVEVALSGTARFVRVTQTGRSAKEVWAVSEVEVFGPAPPR
jgi:hypothetical protein